MLDIRKLVEGIEVADVRAAVYYVSRYIKQADTFDEYSKDIFEDEERSTPNQPVRRLAVDIIKAIEAHERMKAAGINFERVVEILDELTAFERDLISVSDAELAAAAEFTASMRPPDIDD